MEKQTPFIAWKLSNLSTRRRMVPGEFSQHGGRRAQRRLRADNKFHEVGVYPEGEERGEDVVRRNTPDIRVSEYRALPCDAACKPSARSWLEMPGEEAFLRRGMQRTEKARRILADPEHSEFNIN